MMTPRFVTRCVATAATTLAAAAVVAGCGAGAHPSTNPSAAPTTPASAASGATPAAGAHNQADVTFAQDMIPHHAEAIQMATLAPNHASSAQVKQLASRIDAEQQPEIDQMSGFLRFWNAPVPDTSMPMNAMPGMDHGSVPGMMSPQQMQQLGHTQGTAFDTMFLQGMIGHHQGAVTMAQTELANGTNPAAKTLAQNIITAQQREIGQMRAMLGTH